AWGGTPRSLERGVLVVGGSGDRVVLAGDAQAAGYPLDALRVGGHLLLHVLREDADELERGLRVGDASPRLLPLKPDASDDLMRPKTAAQHSLSEVVGPIADRRRRQRQHERKRLAFTEDVQAHHVLACLAATATFVAAPLIERAGGAGLFPAGPIHLGVGRRHTGFPVHAGARRRLPLAGEGAGPIRINPVMVDDNPDNLLDRIHLIVIKRDLEGEPAAAWNLHPVEGDPEALQFFQKGALVEYRRLEALNNCQCRRVVRVGCRHANLSFHMALRRPTVVFSKTLTSSESPPGKIGR